MKYKLMLLFLTLSWTSLYSFTAQHKAHSLYVNGDYKTVQEYLQKELVEQPFDAELNYNLGVVQHKLKQFEEADASFARSTNVGSNPTQAIRFQSYFNWGANNIAQAFEVLPEDWMKTKVEDETLDKAISLVKVGIEKYSNALVVDSEDEIAQTDKQKAEQLLQMLEQKKQQQEQQDDQKQDNDKSDDKQDDQDKDQQNDQNAKKDSDESDTSDDQEKQDKQDSNEKDGDKDKQDKKDDQHGDGQQDDSQGKQESDEDDESEQDTDQSDQQKDEQPQDDLSDDAQDRDSGFGDEDDSGQEQDAQRQEAEQEQGDAQEQHAQAAQAAQVQEDAGPQKSMHRRRLEVLLDKLNDDESQLQKRRIYMRTKGEQTDVRKGQNPW